MHPGRAKRQFDATRQDAGVRYDSGGPTLLKTIFAALGPDDDASPAGGERRAARTALKACASLRRAAISVAAWGHDTRDPCYQQACMHKTQTDSVRTVLALLLGLVELAAVFLLSKQLAGHRDRDVVSFVLPYRPTAQTLKRSNVRRTHGIR